jgi:hypothetical protein
MNTSQTNSRLQIALILGALVAGGLVTQVVPERIPLAGYVQHTDTIPTTAVFKSASAKKPKHDASRDISGIDVDFHRLALLGRIS